MARCWLPNAQSSGAGSASGDSAIQIAQNHKGSGDVVRLPVPAALLKLGSQLTVGGLSYGDLRTAAQPEKLVSSGTPATPAPDATATDPGPLRHQERQRTHDPARHLGVRQRLDRPAPAACSPTSGVR